jgi:mannose-6-phosphate isomerase
MQHPDPLDWLSKSVFPLWLERGLDREQGGFVENLSAEGLPVSGPRRCMVQARQIFSMRAGLKLGVADPGALRAALESGLALLLDRYSLPSGAFRHSIDAAGRPLDDTPDLYGQAFALFALAEGFAVRPDPALRERGEALVAYLRRERAAPAGGFTELEDGARVFRSNPHMHLFEAALAWLEADSAPLWAGLARELAELCLTRFYDAESGAIAERFHEGWGRETEDGRYVYEPGHLCEWSWLLGRYERLTGRDFLPVRTRLFELGERTGRDPGRGALIDQVWSDGAPKLRSARFWPQCERIKAASQLGRAEAAREGTAALFRYFDTKVAGLWNDTWDESGAFHGRPVKASSLYHIIGAILELHKPAP